MYALSEKQIDFILNDIKIRGVEMEDLQLNLLDHICCIIECELEPDGDFEIFYQKTIPRFFKKELKEIEEETILLLTFKNYYAMKKVMIRTGIISVIALMLGSFFKVMQWPGAGPMLVLGIGSMSLIFLPLMFILKVKDNSSKRDKLILALSLAIGVALCWATLFSVMHRQGAGILWLSAISISTFLLIPIYFFTGIRNPDTKLNTIITTIVLIGATGLQFTMLNLHPTKLTEIEIYSYLRSDDLLEKIQGKEGDTSNVNLAQNNLAGDINKKAGLIKALLFLREGFMGETYIGRDFGIWDLYSIIADENLGIEYTDHGRRIIKLLTELKADIIKYNSSGSTNGDNKIPVVHHLMLDVKNDNEGNKIPFAHTIFDIEADELIGRYSTYSILNSITQLQMYLAIAENKESVK